MSECVSEAVLFERGNFLRYQKVTKGIGALSEDYECRGSSR